MTAQISVDLVRAEMLSVERLRPNPLNPAAPDPVLIGDLRRDIRLHGIHVP